MKKQIPIIYEDEAIIVIDKPAGMPCEPDKTRDVDCETLLKHHVFEEGKSEGEPYISAVHRLDRPVGGLMVYAKDSKTAAALSRQIKEGEFEKYYQAVIRGRLEEEFGTFEDYLLRDGKTNLTTVVKKGTKDARRAELDYELIDEIETKDGVLSWVLVILQTGRHHQIRVQFASRGLPLYGDTKYGPKQATKPQGKNQGKTQGKGKPQNKPQDKLQGFIPLGLYSTRIAFTHPTTGEPMVFKTEPMGPAFDAMDVEAF